MTEKQVKGLLELAGEKVPCGVYAIRKGPDYYEMMNQPVESKTQLKRIRNGYRRAGIKVYCNGI